MFAWTRQPASNTRSVASNMSAYVAEATLPPLVISVVAPEMPPEGHKSHRNNLTVRPERYRTLKRMSTIDDENLVQSVRKFTKLHVPSDALAIEDKDPSSGERPYLPAKGFNIPPARPRPLRHVEELGVSWIDNYVLRTLQRVFQMLPGFEIMSDWSFNRPDTQQDLDHDIFRYFLWERERINGAFIPIEASRQCGIVLAYQPAWILSPQDLLQFVHTQSLPMFGAKYGAVQNRYNGAQRTWGKLWDICRSKKCRTFVLTNYSHWVFGGFSRGWSHGHVTTIKEYDDNDPSILQIMLYWANCSLRPDEDYIYPQVPELIANDENDISSIQLLNQTPLAPSEYAASESQWEAQSITSDCRSNYSTSSTVDSKHELLRFSPDPDDPDTEWNPSGPGSKENLKRLGEKIGNWDGRRVKPRYFSVVRSPSPVPSDWSDSSVATVKQEEDDSLVPDGFFWPSQDKAEVYEVSFSK